MFGERYDIKGKVIMGIVVFIFFGLVALALSVYLCFKYKKVKRLEDLGISGGKYDKADVGHLGEDDEDVDRINTLPSRDLDE